MAFEDGPGVPIVRDRRHNVYDPTGYFNGNKGDFVDLHRFFTDKHKSDLSMPVHTKEMRVSGLFPGGFVLISRAIPAREGAIVAVRMEGQVVIRRLVKQDGVWCLRADDPRERPFFITEGIQVERVGVITSAHIMF